MNTFSRQFAFLLPVFMVWHFSLQAQSGTALAFDGFIDNVRSESNVGISGNAERTLSFWIKVLPTNLFNEHLVNWGGTDLGESFGFYQSYNSELIFYGYGPTYDYNTGFFFDNNWHQVVATYDGSLVRTYVDGVETPTSGVAMNLNTTDGKLVMGIREDLLSYTATNMQLDEVRVWDRVLCEGEIQALKDCELSGSEPNLKLYYQFNEGIAGGSNAGVTSVPDITGNGNDGALSSFALFGTASNWIDGSANGISGTCSASFGDANGNGVDDLCEVPATALDFDGTNDYVRSNGHVGISGNAARTLSFWVKTDPTFDFAKHIINWGGTNLGNSFGFYQSFARDLVFYGFGAPEGFDYVTGFQFDNNWHYVAATYDGTHVRTFVDGEETPNSNIALSLNTTDGPLTMGIREDLLSFTILGLEMDEVRVWDRALCEAEIAALMNCELNGDEPGLMLYYQFNEGIVGANNPGETTVPDLSSSGNDATLYHFSLSGDNSNWIDGSANGISGTCNAPLGDSDNNGITDLCEVPDVVLDYKNSENGPNAITNPTIKPQLRLRNLGTTSVDLEDFTIRYYFTSDGVGPMTLSCLSSDAGCPSTLTSLMAITPGVSGADRYLEIGFSGGTIAPGQRINTKTRIGNVAGLPFNEADDWSSAGVITDHINNPNVTLFYKGVLIQGNTPCSGANPCRQAEPIEAVDVAPLEVEVFPNPFQEGFVVEFMEAPAEDYVLRLFNLIGKEVFTTVSDKASLKVKTAHLAPGVYILQVRQGEVVKTSKLVKE